MPLNLFKRPGSPHWYIRGSIGGKNVKQSSGLSDKADADAYRARFEAELVERHAFGRAATLTFAEAALTYIEAGGERRFLAPIARYFGAKTKLTEIDNDAVNRAARRLYPNAAPATINRQLITPISAIVTMAAADGLCPPRRIRRRPGDQKRLRWLTPEEFERLIDAADPHLVPVLAFLIGTGCRTGEALALERALFYENSREAFIPHTKSRTPRMVRFPNRTLEIMQAAEIPAAGPVFLTPRHRPYVLRDHGGGQISGSFRKACNTAGLGRDVIPHVLRHTWATWFYSQTRDFGSLLDLGGWAKADMANRYRKIAPRDLGERLLQYGWDYRDGTAPIRREVLTYG